MPLITARLLGVPELLVDGELPPAPLRWRKHFGLCLLLWNSAARRVSRDTALSMLWGDRNERDARHSLNEALRVIRRSAGADAIGTGGDVLQWLAPVALDTDAYSSVERADPLEAAALIRGAWCEGFSVPEAGEFERWLDNERRSWQHRLVAVLCEAAQRYGDACDPVAAMAVAELARRLDPLNEGAARAVIRTHALLGDRSSAIAEADAFVSRLHEELGVVPDGETLRLLRQVAASNRVRPLRDIPGSRREVPFVGRGDVLAHALSMIRKVQTGGTSALMVVDGEPGSGRTRLLEEVQLRAGLDGFTVLTVRAVPSDETTDRAGLRAIAGSGLASSPGIAAVSSSAIDALAAASPAWAERFVPSGATDQVSLHDALVAAMRATANERPLLIGVDDVEWLDAATLELIPEIMRGVSDLPVVLVLTTQTGSTRVAVDVLRRHVDRTDRGASLRLEPMQHEELVHATRMALPGWDAEAHDRLARRLLAESAGLPAVAVGVLEAVIQGLALDDISSTWPAANRTMDATMPSRMPDALTAAVRLRFHQLESGGRDLLALVAIHTAPVTAKRLTQLTGLTAAAVEPQLDTLEWDRWLVVDSRGYRFRARAVGTLVANEMLTPGQRQRLEARLAAN